MNIIDLCKAILSELEGVLGTINPGSAEKLARSILNSGRIFVAGAGRSKMMIQGLAMRLMQLGFDAYVVGETITPAIQPQDLLIIGSGSGETGTLKVIAKNTKKIGASLAVITIFPKSSIGQLADIVVQLNAATTKGKERNLVDTIQPGANLFEQSMLLFCDAIVIRIIELKQLADSNNELMNRHANLE